MGTHPIFESDFDCLTEKKMTSTLPSNVEQLTLGGSPWLRIHILTTQNSSAITEQKFDKSLTVGQFKGKLELITGYNSGSMKLSIISVCLVRIKSTMGWRFGRRIQRRLIGIV